MVKGPDFTKGTKEILAKRAGQVCSNPDCRRPTSGAHSQDEKAINLGEAAHIKSAREREARFDPRMTDAERSLISNGIWLCRECARKIDLDEGKYTVELLHRWKKEHEDYIASGAKHQFGVSVILNQSRMHGDIAQQIIKISTSKSPKIVHPAGSLGADLDKRGYIDYLIKRYYDLRAADASYGRKTHFSHAVIHSNIQRRFGCKTFFMPVAKFEALASYIQLLIDRTIQGKRNRANGRPNYHSYEEHITKTTNVRVIK